MVTRRHHDDLFDSPNMELASCQASLAFERTLISLDRLLMGAVRTSLALISFGFAMVLFFRQISAQMGVDLRVPARDFGLALLAMGVGLVTVGLLGHWRRFHSLKVQMDELHSRNLLTERCPYRYSPITIFAVLLLLAALLVMAGILAHVDPLA